MYCMAELVNVAVVAAAAAAAETTVTEVRWCRVSTCYKQPSFSVSQEQHQLICEIS